MLGPDWGFRVKVVALGAKFVALGNKLQVLGAKKG